LLAAACYAVGAVALPAAAQAPLGPDPEVGYDLAARVCSACHLIEPRHAGPVIDGVPSLMRIAETLDDAEIEDLLVAPSHPAMPESPLDRTEQQHLLAYIRSLAGE
jgi:hypothetical protein